MRGLRGLLRGGDTGSPPVEEKHERCLSCSADLEGSRSYALYRVCHSCSFHFHLSALERIALLLDPATFRETDRNVSAVDPLSFDGRGGYRSRVVNARRRTGLAEAVLTGSGVLQGRDVEIAVLDFAFLGGSIGVAAGERIARAFERATARQIPVITVASTSGTRMQEGLLALMQAPRIGVALRRHARAGLPHIAVITDPTTGSAYSGFVSLADVILAEPNALIGYGALRAVAEAEGSELPAGAHTAERHLAHGLIDGVVPRSQIRGTLGQLLELLSGGTHMPPRPRRLRELPGHAAHDAWAQVQLSRHLERPSALDFARAISPVFFELHGDRTGEDAAGVIAGPGLLGNEPAMIIAQARGREGVGESLIRPAGFRKAQRAMLMAEKFRLPIVTLVDTPGADPSLHSEDGGLGHALASCMATMLDVAVPTIAVITGEARSEGAMALAVADRVLMLDNAVYEVVRPEDAARMFRREADDIAERLRLTSHDCEALGIVDAIIPEPGEGAHTDPVEAALLLQRAVLRHLAEIAPLGERRRLSRRFHRYRETGTTLSWVRGAVERRLAAATDRLAALGDRLRKPFRARRQESAESPEIPV